MASGSLLLLLLVPLALGCLVALAFVVVQVRRHGQGPRVLLGLGGLVAMLVGAGAVLLWMPPDGRAYVQLEAADGQPLEIELGGSDAGSTPVRRTLDELFALAEGAVPTPWTSFPRAFSPSPAQLGVRDREALVDLGNHREGLAAAVDPADPGRAILTLLDGRRPLRDQTALLELQARTRSDLPARVRSLAVEREGVLGKGPRVYRVILGAP